MIYLKKENLFTLLISFILFFLSSVFMYFAQDQIRYDISMNVTSHETEDFICNAICFASINKISPVIASLLIIFYVVIFLIFKKSIRNLPINIFQMANKHRRFNVVLIWGIIGYEAFKIFISLFTKTSIIDMYYGAPDSFGLMKLLLKAVGAFLVCLR